MPRPGYIICSASYAEDRTTNLLSLLQIVECFDGIPITTSSDGKQIIPMGTTISAISVWVKEEGDSSTDMFETQINCIAPDGSEFFTTPIIQFSFGEGGGFYRTIAKDIAIPGFPVLGTYLVGSKVRRVGETVWMSQQPFPFVVRLKA